MWLSPCIPPIALIFKGTGKRIPKKETSQYPSCVKVFWSKSASWNRGVAIGFGNLLNKGPFKNDRVKFLWFDGLGMRDGIKHDNGHFYKEFQTSLDSGNWKQVVHKPRESKWAQGVDLNVGATIKSKMYKRIRAANEVYYQKKKANPDLPKMTTSELRLLTIKALKEAWVETVEERRVMIRAFEKTGIRLKVDGSDDAEKMKFQGRRYLKGNSVHA